MLIDSVIHDSLAREKDEYSLFKLLSDACTRLEQKCTNAGLTKYSGLPAVFHITGSKGSIVFLWFY